MRAFYGKWTEVLFSCGVAEWEKYQTNPNPISRVDEVCDSRQLIKTIYKCTIPLQDSFGLQMVRLIANG